MAVSVTILVLIIALHLIAFVFAIGAERRRSEVTLPRLFLSPSLASNTLDSIPASILVVNIPLPLPSLSHDPSPCSDQYVDILTKALSHTRFQDLLTKAQSE